MWCSILWYGVATFSRIDKIIGLFCKRDLQKGRYSAKETYDFIDPTDRSHPIFDHMVFHYMVFDYMVFDNTVFNYMVFDSMVFEYMVFYHMVFDNMVFDYMVFHYMVWGGYD